MPGALASLDRLGDESLVTMALRGKREAFDLLCLRNLDRIYGTLHAALGSAEEAERSASDVLLAIVAGLPDFQGDTSYHAWQYSILRQFIKDRLRGKYRHPELISELWFEGLPGDPDLPLLDRTRAWSEGALGQLAPAHRQILEDRLIRRAALDHAAVGLDVDDSRAIALQYFALRNIAVKGIPGAGGSEAELYLEQEDEFLDEHLKKRMEAVNRYVEGLITEESHSDVGRMITKEDVPALRAAHALWYAGSNDYEQRLEPEIVHVLQQLGWETLVRMTGNDSGRSRFGRNPVVIGGVALLFILSLASGYLVNGPAPEEPDIPYKGKTVEVKPRSFGKLAAAVTADDPSLQPEGVAYVWVGGDFTGMPVKSPVLRLATRPASEEEAATFASRFGLDEPALEPSEDLGTEVDSWLFGQGTYDNPRPGTYRLQVEKATGRFSYLHIGTPKDIDAEADEISSPPELSDSEKSVLAGQAKDFLASKGLLAPFHSDPRVLAPGSGGPNVQVIFGRQIRQQDVLDETGAEIYADVSVLMTVDGGVIEVTGGLPRDWESSEYELTPPQEALKSLTRAQRGGPPEVTVTFNKASLVYRAVEIGASEKYLEPVYLLTGKVAGSDEVFKKLVPAISQARN